ncbi:metal-sulfur cluster assembly factor, partial [Streptomyces zhihengii]
MVTDTRDTETEARLRRIAGSVPDPELPVLTLEELGVVREVRLTGPGRVRVDLTPTYTGCPAVEAMTADIERVLHEHGVAEVSVVKVLSPAWSTRFCIRVKPYQRRT